MRLAAIVIWVLCMTASSLDLWAAAGAETRQLRVCVADDAPDEVKAAAADLLQRWQEHPLLAAMAQGASPGDLRTTGQMLAASADERAMNHLVIIAGPSDPLASAVWQREARLTADGLYVFGFGYLVGDVGYIESDRNPFLHGAAIKSAPYETQSVLITGTTPAGIVNAVKAFLERRIVNAVVMSSATRRGQAVVLQRDGLRSGETVPDWLPAKEGAWSLIGLTDPGEDEYRGVLEDTGATPVRIWRAKYHRPGEWDQAGADNAIAMYLNGLHRRAYGNTLWLAEFDTEAAASAAQPLIGQKSGKSVIRRGKWLLMSSVPGVTFASLEQVK